ncbi:hypothetical protein AB0O31_06165 [Kitasatospora cineracea]|uniref:HNH endonuclease n=1 Tax=Kitasatospora cineracea TaxID=88074 RepID=UPI0034142DEF
MGNRKKLGPVGGRPKMVAICHDMAVYENFERAAMRIFQCVRTAEEVRPGAPRTVYLSIQGHRNEVGGYDHDAFELMYDFLLGFLGDYLTEIHTPFHHIVNSKKQRNDLPDELYFGYPDDDSEYGYDAADLTVVPRENYPETRKSRPSVRAIADYLGLDEPTCLVCWHTSVERAHVVPDALGGSQDVRNFALLCKKHHAQAPDVADAESFWAWVDYAELRDSPDKWLTASGEEQRKLEAYGITVGVAEREQVPFLQAVREELVALYGWRESEFGTLDWMRLTEEVHEVLDVAASKHFSIEKKVSTHAWAYHVARHRIIGPTKRMNPITRLERGHVEREWRPSENGRELVGRHGGPRNSGKTVSGPVG